MRRFSVNFAILSILLDAGFIILALKLAIYLHPMLKIGSPIGTQPLPIWIYPLFVVAWVLILTLLSIYDGRRSLFLVNEFTILMIGALVASVSLAGIVFLTHQTISRLTYLFFIILAYLGQASWRIIARAIFHLTKHNPNQRRVLIVGAGPVGRQLENQIQQLPYLGLTICGFLDDDTIKQKAFPEILGQIADLQMVVHKYAIDDIVIALPARAYEQISELVSKLHTLPVKVWIIPDYFHLALQKAQIQEFAGLPMLDLRAPAISNSQRLIKRIFDLVICLPSMLVVLPVIGAIALAIRIDSPGPVFYYSKRVGENGKLFGMIKFRTMVDRAEEMQHLVEQVNENGDLIHKTNNDPRVTRLGRLLRRSSLDEIPQFFNVLKGEMSLVGPRPELPYLVEKYELWQHKRFAVPQGITGWWQVNGRSDKPMHLHTEDDLYYIQNYSLGLDIQILVKTLWVVVRGKGAY